MCLPFPGTVPTPKPTLSTKPGRKPVEDPQKPTYQTETRAKGRIVDDGFTCHRGQRLLILTNAWLKHRTR